MSTVRLRLMHREALQRLDDADLLHRSSGPEGGSNSVHLLQLLGLELLLKLLHEVALKKRAGRGHAYEKIFGALPTDLQNRLLKIASDRIGAIVSISRCSGDPQRMGEELRLVALPI